MVEQQLSKTVYPFLPPEAASALGCHWKLFKLSLTAVAFQQLSSGSQLVSQAVIALTARVSWGQGGATKYPLTSPGWRAQSPRQH